MAGSTIVIYRNLNDLDNESGHITSSVFPTFESAIQSSKDTWENPGYHVKEYNTQRNGEGTSYQPGNSIPDLLTGIYLIWESDSMSYIDINTPVIEKITLPSGNTYYIADREIRNVVEAMGDAIAGGVSFIVGWDGTSEPVVANIPAGVEVAYEGASYTGTLSADNATPGAFYLIKSATTTTGTPSDSYDEYVPVGSTGSKTWEKIGDTQVDLSDVVTGVSLTKQTDTVIGSDATFTITQPTISLATDSTSGTGKVQVVTGVSNASASGGGAAWNSKDQKTVITSYPGVTGSAASSVTPTTKKLATSSVTGVQSSTTTASKATAATSQTTATGAGTTSTTNTDWLKGVSVSNGTLTIGAATMNTQTTTQQTFTDVTVPIKASSATTVATGATTTSGSGADVVTDVEVGDTVTVLTGLGTPNTANVIGSSSTFTNTQPTITVTPSTTNIKATASGANTAWNNKDSVTVLKNTTDVNVTKGQ